MTTTEVRLYTTHWMGTYRQFKRFLTHSLLEQEHEVMQW